MKLLRGRGVYDTRDGGLSLASFRSVSKISMPTTTAGSLRVETVVTGETRQYLENGMERTLRSRQDISEVKERLVIIPYMDRTLASNRRRYLQLVRDLLKRNMVNLIEAKEVRERVGVCFVEKPWKNTQRMIIDARVSNLHFLPPVESQEVGAPFGWTRVLLFQQPADGSYLESTFLSKSNRRGHVGHTWPW